MKILEEIEGLVSSRITVVKAIITVIKLETRLAGLSIFPLLLTLGMLGIALVSFWITGMVLVGYGVFVALASLTYALMTVMLLNAMLLGVLLKCVDYNIRRMRFEKTRQLFGKTENKPLKKENNHV